MSGGGGGSSKYKSVQPTELQTTGYGGMGYTQVPQTWNQASKPAWMQGAWDMPTWGQAAAAGGDVAPVVAQAQPPGIPGKGPELGEVSKGFNDWRAQREQYDPQYQTLARMGMTPSLTDDFRQYLGNGGPQARNGITAQGLFGINEN